MLSSAYIGKNILASHIFASPEPLVLHHSAHPASYVAKESKNQKCVAQVPGKLSRNPYSGPTGKLKFEDTSKIHQPILGFTNLLMRDIRGNLIVRNVSQFIQGFKTEPLSKERIELISKRLPPLPTISPYHFDTPLAFPRSLPYPFL